MAMSAIAVTDHGVMFGALGFYEAARAHGIKPILGVEAYVAPGSRFDREPGENEEKYHHLTLLARDETGYRNLLQLVSAAHLEGFYHRPRMDKQLLAEHAEGLTCLSGCLSSELSKLLIAGQDAASPRRRRAVSRHLRCGQLLDRAPGPRVGRAGAGDPEAGGARARARDRPGRHERPALHDGRRREAARRAALHPAAEAPVGPEAAAVRLRGVLPEVRRADARPVRRAPGGVRQHARDRGVGGPRADLRGRRGTRGPVPPAALRGPGRAVARGVPAGADPRGSRRAVRRPAPRRDRGATGLRDERDPADGSRRLLPDRVGPDPVRAGAGDPCRAGARVRRRLGRVLLPAHHRRRSAPLRADLRALPEPRADPDARHRHGLRRAPAGRGHPVRAASSTAPITSRRS